MDRRHSLAALGALTLASPSLRAQGTDATLRIGLIASYTGPYADYGRQFDAGIALYLKEHGNRIAGRGVEILRRDTAGANPATARRFAQELVTRDGAQLLTGLDFSPNAYAVAPVVTQARVPTLVMNAASSAIPASSPYIARLSFTVQQVSDPMARWMLRQGIREAFTVVADYASGHDAEAAFTKAFTAGGGSIAGSLRTPMNNPDFSAYVQRIRDQRPAAVFFFFPSGVMPPAFLKAWKERGMERSGTRLFATGEATDDSFLDATGDIALGLVTSHHYSYANPSAKNRRFVQEFEAANGKSLRPSYFAVSAYDTMAAIDTALARTRGSLDGDAFMEALKGLRLDSPRGPIEIDATTRDIVQTVYIRRVESRDGRLVNTEFDRFERVKDPAKE